MGYPILRRNMRRIVRDALLDDDLAREPLVLATPCNRRYPMQRQLVRSLADP